MEAETHRELHDPAASMEARSLAAGDWVEIDYQGRKLTGMIDRLQDGVCTFAYWEGDVLKFGTATPAQIGDWDECLTRGFRAAIAVDPHYLAKFIAMWKGKIEFSCGGQTTTPKKTRCLQKRLFPEE